ncbi:hypothetical protein [Spirosoma sordidisoli]|uniref:Uncharacterized protein n=1 Tax=Spirosoma sordidisoli TaxID=2502893 RepID=A0A4Q2ULJ9_9BACT|nr:hypothetical protein [Spirosoma sordidisoli]RYC69602.1 hypothetical protein EQG79_13445 [Spirosoma sordidisoli]
MLSVDERVEKIRAILDEHYEESDEQPVQAGTDLLTDLMHFLWRQGASFTEVKEMALYSFNEERDNDKLNGVN